MSTRNEQNAGSRPARRRKAPRSGTPHNLRHGFYTSTFTPAELRQLDAEAQGPHDERKLLRTKILRLARLIPLKKISAAELDALIKLTRLIAALDALERTGVMARKVDGVPDPGLQLLAEIDSEDL